MPSKRVPVPDLGQFAVAPGRRLAILSGRWIIHDAGQIRPVVVADLAFEHQPREVIPEEQLQLLIAEGHARPAAVLEALRWAAVADSYYGGVLEALEGLAQSIASQGVLTPIDIVERDGRMILRDGHRRSLAAVIVGLTEVPARQVDEPDGLAAAANPLVVNLQREDLTALEKGAALLRVALLVGRHLAEEQGTDPAAVTIEALVGDQDGAVESAIADSAAAAVVARTVTGLPRALAAQIRDRVCAMTGLKPERYYRFLALNRLTPAARAQARGLTESRLRPIVAVPPKRQAQVLAFAEQHRLSDQALKAFTRIVRSGDEDEVQRLIGRLAAERTRHGGAAPGWKPLLFALPEDWEARWVALTAEINALPPTQREARLAEIERQAPRLLALGQAMTALLAARKAAAPSSVVPSA